MKSDVDTFGSFEAKNRLSELLDRVELGQSIVITRHGQPVARLVPFEPAFDREEVRRAVERFREIRKDIKLGGLSIRALIDEGRR
jgi:prevent-host-death family protein